jgi:hypothetical protein
METAPACVPAELISHRHLDCPRFVVVERVVKLPGDASLQHRAAARKLVLKMLEQRRFRDGLPLGPPSTPFRAAPIALQISSALILSPAIICVKTRSWRVGNS